MQLFSFEYCEIFMNKFVLRAPSVAASVLRLFLSSSVL